MPLRIQKFLSQCGYCSRRKAEELIREAHVTVNDQLAMIGQVIDEVRDIVKVDAICVRHAQKKETIVLMLNKPRGIVCTHSTRHDFERTVFDFIPKAFAKERFLYCGRLDKESQGMLILTNDGDFANKLTHPSSNITKIYHAVLSQPISPEHRTKMLQGIADGGEVLKAEKIIELTPHRDHQALEIHLKQGRRHEIRRMIEKNGSRVHRLKRVQIGQLKLKNLAIGHVKILSLDDINSLFI